MPLTAFYKNRSRVDGVSVYCKVCMSQTNHKSVRKNYKGRICDHCGSTFSPTQATHRWCFDCVPKGDASAHAMMTRYNLARPEFEAMYFEQDGQCALRSCTREAVCVDHCHDTGRVRALLCRYCNSRVGSVENKQWLTDALDYLAEHRK